MASNDESNQYNAETNFLSQNAFTCVEINAYNLLHLIIKFRDAGTPEYFLPTLFQSQASEETFRQLRSMTTFQWTKINFSLMEMIQQISRIELQNQIVFSELAETSISFPRIQNRINKHIIYELPTNEQISAKLEEARNAAILDGAKFSMIISSDQILRCEISKGQIKQHNTSRVDEDNTVPDEGELDTLPNEMHCSNLRNYSTPDNDNLNDNRFVQVVDKDGSEKTVLKSSLIWILSETKGVLSNDRLKRVQSHDGISKKRKQKTTSEILSKRKKTQTTICENNELQIGDWCFFRNHTNTVSNQLANHKGNFVFGAVLGFRYSDGRTEKEKSYTLNYAPITHEQNEASRGVEVLGTWYCYKNIEKLETLPHSNFFLNINDYVGTYDAPNVIKNPVSQEVRYELKEFALIEEFFQSIQMHSLK